MAPFRIMLDELVGKTVEHDVEERLPLQFREHDDPRVTSVTYEDRSDQQHGVAWSRVPAEDQDGTRAGDGPVFYLDAQMEQHTRRMIELAKPPPHEPEVDFLRR